MKPGILICLIGTILLILSCSGEKPSNADTNLIPDPNSSYDFRATGNEPFWSLEIDFDQNMRFTTLNDSRELITPVPKPHIAQDHPVERYRAVTEKGELIVQISPDTCQDTMSDQKFPFTVTVDVKFGTDQDYSSYKGCGRNLLDLRLHNIWALEEMAGETVPAEEFNRGVPTLEIFPGSGRIAGHDGCNRLFGKITGNEGNLTFGALGSTMMACPRMEKSNQFLKLISDQGFQYEFGTRQLVLEQNDEVVLRFKNVD